MKLEKVGAEMSYIQSQMHSDCDSAESIADSVLEDGELRKMLASPGKLATVIQERGASAKRTQAVPRESLMSSSSQEPTASEKLAAMFSSESKEPGNQLKSSIFKDADPSNLRRSLLEGNKDHLLSQARSSWISQQLYQ